MQHWARVLKPSGPRALALLNLNGDLYNDIYTTIIDGFTLKYGGEGYFKNPVLEKYINRKFLKKNIMTVNYNSTKYTCYTYYKSTILNAGAKLEESDIKDVLQLSNDLHDFTKTAIFAELFINDKEVFLSECNDSVVIDGLNVPLHYLDSCKIDKVIKVSGKRWKFTETVVKNSVNSRKTTVALPANIVQAKDAEFARYIIDNVPCYTIHDSFGVSIFDVTLLMDKSNEFFSNDFGYETYSMFILL